MDRIRIVACFTTVVSLALAAPAFAGPPGVNLRWDQCFSDGGVQNRTFACDTNAGSERLVMSFRLDTDMQQVSGQEIRLILVSATPAVPAWWDLKNLGSCRRLSLGLSVSPPAGSANCEDWASGSPADPRLHLGRGEGALPVS